MRNRTSIPAALQAQAALALLSMPEPEKLDVAKELDLPLMHEGPQTLASESHADIIFYGGQKGGGKTIWLDREGMRHYKIPGWRALLLRRKLSEVTESEGLWESTRAMYEPYSVSSVLSPKMRHTFTSRATVTVGGCQYDANRKDYDGSGYGFIGFDQVEMFTESQFWYMALSLPRATTGIPSRVGATANPVTEKNKIGGWLCTLLMDGGWVSRETGYAVEAMSGVVLWLYRRERSSSFDFHESREKAMKANPSNSVPPISVTFIPAKLTDNPTLMRKDPGYEARLAALPWLERERVYRGNWKVSSEGGGLVKREWIRRLHRDPGSVSYGQPIDESYYSATVRGWDLAATAADEKGGAKADRTATVKESRVKKTGRFVLRQQLAFKKTARQVRDEVVRIALVDGPGVVIRIYQDPAQAGKGQALDYLAKLREAFAADGRRPPKIFISASRESKTKRFEPFYTDAQPAQVDADGEVTMYGNIDIVEGPQTDDCLDEYHHFDGSDSCADDFVDCTSDAHAQLIIETNRRTAGVY